MHNVPMNTNPTPAAEPDAEWAESIAQWERDQHDDWVREELQDGPKDMPEGY